MTRAAIIVRSNWPALLVTAAFTALMLAFAGQYGLHRDEMYFIVAGRHPDFGYVDQPPFTPIVNALSVAVFGVSAFGDRILPTVVYAVVVLLGVRLAGEFGGGRLAQTIAAITVAGSGWIAVAHLNSTEVYDILGWTVFLLVVVRILRGGDQRLWLLAGLAAGIALENKNLIVFLAAGLGAGIAISRRWELLRSRWIWAGAGLALLIWLPNLIWQAENGWPQLEMARVIAARSGDENRSQLILIQVLFFGPLLFPVALAGLWWLLRSDEARDWRPIGWAYPVILVLLFITAGKSYYVGGLVPTIIAAGSVVTARWLTRGGVWMRRARGATYAIAAAASVFLVVSLSLPVVPAADFPRSTQATVNSDAVSEYGWPSFVAQVRAVTDSLSSEDRARTAILTVNYGEAGALELLSSPGLPPVYSGENSYAYWGPPADSKTITVMVTDWVGAGAYWGQWLGPCTLATTIDLGFPPDISEEQGAGVWVCRGRTAGWDDIWSRFRGIG